MIRDSCINTIFLFIHKKLFKFYQKNYFSSISKFSSISLSIVSIDSISFCSSLLESKTSKIESLSQKISSSSSQIKIQNFLNKSSNHSLLNFSTIKL